MIRPVFLFWVALLVAEPAFAGGAWTPVRGVRALSVGGAYVAGAEGTNALWYNPSRLDATGATIEMAGVFLNGSFTTPEGEIAQNQGRALPNPTVGGVFRVNEMLSLAAGAYAPYSPQLGFDEDGPQRYSLVQSDRITMLYMHVAAALRLDGFRIGGGIQNVNFHLRQRSTLSGYTGLFGQPKDKEFDILTELDMNDPFQLTGNVGMSVDWGPLTFGAALQLPYTMGGQAQFRVRLGTSVFFDPIKVEGDSVDFEVPFPMMIRSGLQWRVNEDLNMELAFNWEDWSIQDELVIDPKGRIKLTGVPGIGDYDMGKLVVDRRMKDTYSVHLGGDYQVIKDLHLRSGIYYETSSFDDVTYSVAQLDGRKLSLAGGLAYKVAGLRIDAALSYVRQFERNITNSELVQVNPTNPDQGVVIGNGLHNSHMWIAGLGVAWELGG